MAKIKVEVDYTISDGCEIKFHCPNFTGKLPGLTVEYPTLSGSITSKTFTFVDEYGNSLQDVDYTVTQPGSLLFVVLDVKNSKAHILNSATHGYVQGYVDEKIGVAIGGSY